MTVETTTKRHALVWRDFTYPHRWYDAVGQGVTKYLQDFTGSNWFVDDTTHDPSPNWTMVITEAGAGDTTVNLTDVSGGALLITTAGNENDGVQMQFGHAASGVGESVDLSGDYPLYFSTRFAISDVDQTDILVGFCITDVDALGAVSDGIYFRSADESAVLYFVTEKNSIESAVAVATLVDATYITAEFLYDAGTVTVYINGVEVTSVANTAATFPNDELLRLTLEFLTGAVATPTLTMTHLRYIHISE